MIEQVSQFILLRFLFHLLFYLSLLPLNLQFFFNKHLQFVRLENEGEEQLLIFLQPFPVAMGKLRRLSSLWHNSKILAQLCDFN
jgi:hypothetical protein